VRELFLLCLPLHAPDRQPGPASAGDSPLHYPGVPPGVDRAALFLVDEKEEVLRG
jgi:hypothetical protein